MKLYLTAMKQEILRVFFAVAICPSLFLLLASGHTHGLGISEESGESSPSCCPNHHSKLHQSSQVVNGDSLFSRNSGDSADSFVDIPMSAEFVDNTTCIATWIIPKESSNGTSCECGSSLGGIIECDSSSGNVSLLRCYCMTFDVNKSMVVVGRCLYGCVSKKDANPYYSRPSNTSKLNELCSKYHREGQLCGRCEEGFALPVYSYNFSCVNCTNPYANNWMKYLAVSLLPLTLFFTVIVTCRVRVTSGLMNAFILLCQIISLPAVVRAVSHSFVYDTGSAIFVMYGVMYSFYSMWNLDFFRLLYRPFCLHPETTTLQILALDYVIAVYPLVLLVVVYLFVKIHDSNFKVIVCLWRPFHRCFVYFRKDWNIKTSLIDSFATFLLLSYMKFLSVSLNLLVPVPIFNIKGETLSKYYLYWDGTIELFGSEHLPYAILALTVLIIFNILPLLLMCLYPCRWFQKCLNYCRFKNQILHIFMDAFQGCYKDGTNGSRDCRWFAGLYFFCRILIMVLMGVTISQFFLPLVGCVALVSLLLAAVLQPYKANVHNRINIFFLLVIVLLVLLYMAIFLARYGTVRFTQFAKLMFILSTFIPVMYIVGVIIYKLFAHRMCIKVYPKLCRICMKPEEEDFVRILPERMVNVEECAVLLADPMEVNA